MPLSEVEHFEANGEKFNSEEYESLEEELIPGKKKIIHFHDIALDSDLDQVEDALNINPESNRG